MADQIYIGSRRLEWMELQKRLFANGGAIVQCSCYSMLQTMEALFAHYQMGHFDIPVYATREEMIREKLKMWEERRARRLDGVTVGVCCDCGIVTDMAKPGWKPRHRERCPGRKPGDEVVDG